MVKRRLQYLEKEELEPGNIVPVYVYNKFEAFGILIEPAGEPLSFLHADGYEDEQFVYMKQRWLIEWARASDIKNITTTEHYWSQKYIEGQRTHRQIIYYGARDWEKYYYSNGTIKRKNHRARGDDGPINDSNIIF